MWFLPIFFAPQFEGFTKYGIDLVYAKVFYVLPVILGVGIFGGAILLKKNIIANKYGLALILFIYGHSLLSNVGKFEEVIYFSLYALMVHFIGYNYPKILFQQYFVICGAIVFFVLVDYFVFAKTEHTLFNWHTIGTVSGIVRAHTFFNEPSHQAGFLMPALLYRLFNNRERFDIWLIALLFAYLATFSVAAFILLLLPVIFYYISKRNFSYVRLLYLFVICIVIVTISGEFIFEKLMSSFNIEMYLNSEKVSSGTNYITMRDIAKNTNLADVFWGVGYYNVGNLFSNYLNSSDLAKYFYSQGFYEGDYTSIAILRLIYGFGILGMVIIYFLVKKMYRYSNEVQISIIVIVTLILSFVRETHCLNELVFIFFFFGLFWGENWRLTAKIQAA